MKTESIIKAVIWDMGGVLLRTIDQTPRNRLAESVGLERYQLEEIVFNSSSSQSAEMGKISEEEHLRWVLSRLRQDNLNQQEFRSMFFGGDSVDEQLMDYIHSLRAKKYYTGLLSNAWYGVRHYVSNFNNFLDAFDVCVFSAEVGLRKPDSLIYRLILDRIGIRAQQAIFIDDSIVNVEGARAIGMRSIQFTDSRQIRVEVDTMLNNTE